MACVYNKQFARPDKGVDGFSITDKLPELSKIPAVYVGETWPGHHSVKLDILMSEDLRKKIGASSFGTSDYTLKHDTNCFSKEELESGSAIYINPIWLLKSDKNALDAARAVEKKFPKLIEKYAPRKHYLFNELKRLGYKSNKEVLDEGVEGYLARLEKIGDKESYDWVVNHPQGKDVAFEIAVLNDLEDMDFNKEMLKMELYNKSPLAYFAKYRLKPEAELAMEMIDKVKGKNSKDFRTTIY